MKLSRQNSHFQLLVFIYYISKRGRKHTHFIPLKIPLDICETPVLILGFHETYRTIRTHSRHGTDDMMMASHE